MATRIYWNPPPPPAAPSYYEVYVGVTNVAPLLLAQLVADQRPGPAWDAATGRFFYDDPTGDDATVYRVKAFDGVGLIGDTGVFQPDASFAANLATRQRVDHNFGGPDALAYFEPGGKPVPQAVVRAFKKPDYDAGRLDLALFVTQTDVDGRWEVPFWLEPGLTYVLVFEKRGSYGPDKREVLV